MSNFFCVKISLQKILFIFIIQFFFFLIFSNSFAIESVIIDPGHGGEDLGCVGLNGTLEKDVTFAIARRLEEIIQNRLGIRTALTRTGDYYIDLIERAGIANNFKGDLFLSIHVNTTFTPGQTGQIMVFINSNSLEDNRERTDIIDLEKEEAKSIMLWDEIQYKYQKESIRLANLIVQESKKSGIWREFIIKKAPILILKGINMPAAVVEMDFLTSPLGEERLNNEWYQERMCEVLYRAVLRFSYALEEESNGKQ